MRKIIWQFLNTKYSGVVIYHKVFELDNSRNEKFVTNMHESIMEITYFYNGKEIRTHVSPNIRKNIEDYFCMHYLDVEGYILSWCRDKSVETIEM